MPPRFMDVGGLVGHDRLLDLTVPALQAEAAGKDDLVQGAVLRSLAGFLEMMQSGGCGVDG